MASLSGISDGVFDTIHVINNNQLVEIRDLFGQVQSTVPSIPSITDVLNVAGLQTLLNLKRDESDSFSQTEINNLLAQRRLISDSYSQSQVYTKTETDNALTLRRLISDSFSQSEINNLLAQRRLISDSYSQSQVYTKTETDNALGLRRLISDSYSQSQVYTKTETDDRLALRRLISDSYSQSEVSVLLGQRRLVSDSYSKTEIDAALLLKRNTIDSYNTSQIDTALAGKRNVADSYTKTEVDNLVANAGGGSGLTAAEQTFLDNGQLNISQSSLGLDSIKFHTDGVIKGKSTTGVEENCLFPRFQNATYLRYGSLGFQMQNNSSTAALNINNDLTAHFKNHVHIDATSPELRLLGATDSDTASIKFSTPGTGQTGYKSIIKALGKTDSGKSQLAFLISNSTSNVSATDNDAVMIVDSMGVQIGNPTTLSEPGSSLDVRGGNIELSDFGSTALQHLKWSAFRSNGRHDIAKIVAQSTSTYGGNLILYYRSPNTNVATGANNIGIHISDNGNVGLGAASSSWKLAVPGSLYAVSMTAGTKPFLIKHPDPAKEGWQLKHTAIESDDGGSCLYKRQLECVQGKNEFLLPSWFSHLNEEVLVWANAFKHRGLAWGETIGNVLHVDCSKAGVYNVLIFGQRKDPAAKNHWKGAEIPPSEAVDLPST